MTKILSFVFAAFFAASVANAATLATEDFSYADGDLTTVSGGTWAAHSGAGSNPVQVASGAAVLTHGGSSREDVNLQFLASVATSGVYTATFDIVVTDNLGFNFNDYEYFAHFMEVGTFNFNGRVDVVPPEDDGDYTLGIASNSSTADAVLGVDFAFGDTVSVTLSYDLATAVATLTAGGETESSAAGDIGEGIDAFALRVSNSAADETITIDNLVITGPAPVIPEPSTVALLMLGAVAASAASMRSRLG